MRKIIAGAVVVIVAFIGTLWAMGAFSPEKVIIPPPKLEALPPLQPVTRTSLVVAPTAIALSAIRDAIDAAVPRDFSGQSSNPVSSLLAKSEIGLTTTRGLIAVAGRPPQALVISTPVNGKLRITGKLAGQAGKLTGALGGLFNQAIGQQVEKLTSTVLDQGTDVHGTVAVTSRPQFTPQWRLKPNFSAQANLDNTSLSLSGIKISVAKEAGPLIDKEVERQMAALDARLRNDPFIETAVRREWAKMCRSIPLGSAGSGLPPLWLELRPTRAFAAQPQTDASNLILTVGVEAQTRVLDKATQPSCPFPARLEIVPHSEQGRLSVTVPIDLPLAQVSKLLEAQLKGRHFPEDGSGPVDVQVQHASIAASGDRLLIALRVKAREKKSWFGFGAQADVYVWGRPVLDSDKQILRFTDLKLAVESQAAYGLLGAAAQAAMPYLQDSLAQNAAIDLKPLAADAKKKIGAALADFRRDNGGVRVDADIRDLRLVGIAFDSTTLRVITEADGTVQAQVTKLAGL
jgi:Domain of unknown function (DUF4403)